MFTIRRVLVCLAVAIASATVHLSSAAPPVVGNSLRIGSDDKTITWTGVSGATAYNVYRGSLPNASDLRCLVFRTATTSAQDPVTPAQLFTYLVASYNATGESSLGTGTGGSPRNPIVLCRDDDLDSVRDDQDNCPGLSNPTQADGDIDLVGDACDNCVAVANQNQADQDLDTQGDRCDPATYPFDGDPVGSRPTETTQDGGANSTFVVRDYAGDRGVAYDGGLSGVHDRFDRVELQAPQQDLDLYVDSDGASAETATLELWSSGTEAEAAGCGLQIRLEPSGQITVVQRRGGTTTAIGNASLVSTARLRFRLRKGAGNSSTLAVDRWSGSTWISDAASFTITDDHTLRGTSLTLVQRAGGRKPIYRVTANRLVSSTALKLVRSPESVEAWKLFQRGPSGTAPIPLRLSYRHTNSVRLEVRLSQQSNGVVLPGFDYTNQQFPLAAAPNGNFASVQINAVPAGGNYKLEARLVDSGTSQLLGQDSIDQLAVGDVFLAGGQSNMSGYSGDLSGVEAPSDLVHLFGNDARWARATEPMDGTVDQTDDVSLDPLAQHSPMLRFAKDLSAGIGVPVAIIPGPKGWSDLVTDWARRSDDPTSRGSLYGSLISRGLRQGYSYPLRGLIWFQGERDSVDSGRGFEIYLAALRDFVDDLRIDLAAPDLYFGNFQLATWNAPFLPSWMGVQEAQRVQAQTDSATVVVATVDQPRADCCHLTSAAYREVGRRLAQAMLARLYGRPAVPGPLLQTARFPSLARDRVQLGWDKSVTRREATLFNVTDASGNIPIVLVTGSGALIELHLQRPASGETKVTYGLSSDPLASWTIASDGSGAALAMQNVVVTGP